jgi:branched-chain amino acid aminotransferase
MQFQQPAVPGYSTPEKIAQIDANPGFGNYFSDHMAVAEWSQDQGWHDDAIVPYGSGPIDPGNAVFHYAQEVFEGLKAYRRADGSVWLFRPDANARRFARSADRLALPQLPVEDFLASVRSLANLEKRWVSDAPEHSLYIRPFMYADEDFLGVRAAKTVRYAVICSPVGPYFAKGVAPVDIMVTTKYSRAGAGGTGAAKCGGNYASSLLPQQEAAAEGFSQVLFTDAGTHTLIEELGGMNFFIVTQDDELITPALNGNILAGVTRDSLLKLAGQVGLNAVERPLKLEEVTKGIYSGQIIEAFACGTAAVITPIGSLRHDGQDITFAKPVHTKALELRNLLLDIQYGRETDPYGWTEQVA